MKVRKEKYTFILQATDTSLRILKCRHEARGGQEFTWFNSQPLNSDINEKGLALKIKAALEGAGYHNEPLILCLPRAKATCRYIKIPAQSPQEIEKIVSLQASKYLPYPAEELVSGFEIISRDRAGYSEVNLIIAHRDIIQRYLNIFRELKVGNFKIILSPYGLANLYYYLKPQDSAGVVLVDIDAEGAELALCADKKVLFSRYVKVIRGAAGWEDALNEEVSKTAGAYEKETNKTAPQIRHLLDKEEAAKKVNFSTPALNTIMNTDVSSLSLIGLGLKSLPETLNLLPLQVKDAIRQEGLRKKRVEFVLLSAAIILSWIFAGARNIENKSAYLGRIKQELSRLEAQARPLEMLENRLALAQRGLTQKPSSLEALHELHRVLPANISLVSFSYEKKEVVIRGQAPELSAVFNLAAALEKSDAFRGLAVKVKYATKRKMESGESVDFEINCVRSG